MKIDHLYVVLISLLIGACSISEEKSSKDISAIQLNQVEIPVNIDSATLEKAQLIHKFLVVQLNDSLEGEIMKLLDASRKDSTFNDLFDYLRTNSLKDESLVHQLFR